MSFLTPLYLAGLALVSLPVLLHLIRQTPRGRVLFSSLMFLQPSPPKVTKRSRIEHWLLLLLRAAAMVLLAIAFSRPFFRENEELTSTVPGRRIAVLIDVSASMRRTGLWTQATARMDAVLKSATPQDELAIAVFDSEMITLISFGEWQKLAPHERPQIIRDRLHELTPGWRGTDLAKVLDAAVTEFASRTPSRADVANPERNQSDAASQKESVANVELVVISDFQQGCRLVGLQNFAWPEHVRVRPEFVHAATSNNAGLHPVTSSGPELSVRLDNTVDSTRERFTLQRSTSIDATNQQEAIVPPGQNRVVRVGKLEAQHDRILLSGDDDDFDNSAWFVHPAPRQLLVAHWTDELNDDPQHLRFFLKHAFLSTDEREVVFEAVTPDQPLLASRRPSLGIVSGKLSGGQVESLQSQVTNGLTLLCIGSSAELTRTALQLASRTSLPTISESNRSGYAMLTNIDFSHPLFTEFRDAKLADFTKLPIWKHRVFDKPLPDARVLARFDGEAPAIVELTSGTGRVIVWLFGWHGEESRFVLWSKFVPMLNHLLNTVKGAEPVPVRLTVGDQLPIEKLRVSANDAMRLKTPSGSEIGADELTSGATEPGIYEVISQGATVHRFGVNLDPYESRTSPLGMDELKAIGIPVQEADVSTSLAVQRLLQVRELEARQRLWQWLLVAGFVLLLAETWLAARTTTER